MICSLSKSNPYTAVSRKYLSWYDFHMYIHCKFTENVVSATRKESEDIQQTAKLTIL